METIFLVSLLNFLIGVIALIIWISPLRRSVGKIKAMVFFLVLAIFIFVSKSALMVFGRYNYLAAGNLFSLIAIADFIFILLALLSGAMMRLAIKIINDQQKMIRGPKKVEVYY